MTNPTAPKGQRDIDDPDNTALVKMFKAMTDTLKPCPFCGGTDTMMMKPTCRPETPYNPADRLYPIVRCMSCYCEVVGDNEDYAGKTAITAWNRRPAQTYTQDQLNAAVRAAEAENERLRDEIERADLRLEAAAKTALHLSAENEKLREALKAANHLADCSRAIVGANASDPDAEEAFDMYFAAAAAYRTARTELEQP